MVWGGVVAGLRREDCRRVNGSGLSWCGGLFGGISYFATLCHKAGGYSVEDGGTGSAAGGDGNFAAFGVSGGCLGVGLHGVCCCCVGLSDGLILGYLVGGVNVPRLRVQRYGENINKSVLCAEKVKIKLYFQVKIKLYFTKSNHNVRKIHTFT